MIIQKVASRLVRYGTPLAIAAVTACSSGAEEILLPFDPPALASELDEVSVAFSTAAFFAIGRGPSFADALGGSGRDAIMRNGGTVYRYDELIGGYAPEEDGLEGEVRFILYGALEAVPHGAPLVEVGSLSYFPTDGGLRAILTAEDGSRLEVVFAGELLPVPSTQMLVSAGHIESNGRAYEFESSARIFPDDEGTFVGDFFLEGPDGLKAAYESRTTRITVFAGEEHHGELTIDSRHGRVEMIGDAVGGHGTHAVRFDGVLTAQVHQVSGLTDLIDRIVSSDGGSLADPTTEAAVRQVFRFRNNATTGAVKLLQAIHLP